MTTTCEPIFRLLRKNSCGIWNEDCQEAFDKIKPYLMNPPLLVPPIPRKPLILYLKSQWNSHGWCARITWWYGEEKSKSFIKSIRSSLITKHIIWLRSYDIEREEIVLVYVVLHHMAHLQNRSPEVYIWETVSVKLDCKMQVLLSKYDICYMSRKSIK